MSLVEYKDDIIVIDLGFQFKEEHAPGIDYILPNTKYLEDRKDKIRAVVVTHGHLDHIGGAPYILGKIGNPKIYARLLTTSMIAKRPRARAGRRARRQGARGRVHVRVRGFGRVRGTGNPPFSCSSSYPSSCACVPDARAGKRARQGGRMRTRTSTGGVRTSGQAAPPMGRVERDKVVDVRE